jgi:acyl-homoserine lactone acylase PvdQ
MLRPIVLLAGVLSLALASAASATDFADPALNIIPSGQWQPGAQPPPDAAPLQEQANMYAGLTPLYDQVTADDLTKYFKSERLSPDDSCPCHTEAVPKAGVVIVRDRFNVPHISAPTREAIDWATGWVTEEDRSLVLSVGRYPARLAAVDAPNTSAFSLVTGVKSVVPSAAVDAMIEHDQTAALQRAGAKGQALLQDIDAYIQGINDRLTAEHSAQKPWTRADVYSVNALVGQIFGQGGGDEVDRALFLSALTKRVGSKRARTVFNDLSQHSDPDSPNTTEKRFPFLPVPSKATGNRPLDASSYKPMTGANALAGIARASAARTPHMSNFLMVAANRSESGHPIFVAGPQIGYFFPGLTLEMDLNGPDFQARGASAPGFPGNILIGRGQDDAWTLTSAGSDNIDHYVETLCGHSTTKYLYKGKCQSMGKVDFGTVGGKKLSWRTTVHGPVVGYAKSGGKKVAVSRKRSSYGQDILFQLPFRDMTLNTVHNATEFASSFAQSPFTFNAGYADDRDIAFYSAGLLPVRAKGVDPRLPTDGRGSYEWRGFLTQAQHAQDVNPSDGTLVNWNNRPAAGWGAADDNWEYGAVHRVQMLDAGLARQAKHTPALVVAAMNRAATTDLRVEDVLPVVESVLKTGPAPRAIDSKLVALIDAWRTAGPAWLDRDGDGKVDNAAAAIVEDLYPRLTNVVLEPLLGTKLKQQLDAMVGDNADPGSDFTGGEMGYVVKDLSRLAGKSTKSKFKTRFCGGGKLATCRKGLWAAVDATARVLSRKQGAVPENWRIAEPIIKFSPLQTPTIPFTNRPSGIQQVLSFTGHR